MGKEVLESTYLRATINGPVKIKGKIQAKQNVDAAIGIPKIVSGVSYKAGNGIVIDNRVISLDDLVLDCGTSTTNI